MRRKFLAICCMIAVCITTCFTTGIASAEIEIPSSIKYFQGHYYEVIRKYMTPVDAEAYCNNLGGHLVTITSMEENSIVYSMIKNLPSNGVWIGATDRDSEGNWHWMTGEKWGYTAWEVGEPNNGQKADPHGQDYAQMYKRNGRWDDCYGNYDRYSETNYFVIEWENDSSMFSSLEDYSKQTITFSSIADSKSIKNYKVVYNESYFTHGNSELIAKKGLARLSAVAALSSYGKTSNATDTLSYMSKLKFNDREKLFSGDKSKSGHSELEDNDHAVIYCGWKDLPNRNRLFFFVINGYSAGKYEWMSNFKLGKGSVHSGFENASKELLSIMTDYINQHSDGRNPVTWITGHSRGGALTNMTAMRLIELGVVQKGDMYAYAFAPPRYTTQTDNGYENCILNYISSDDFVPYLAPSDWGYVRKGTNITLKNKAGMKEKFKTYKDRSYKGYTSDQRKSIVKKFTDFGKSQIKYADGYEVNGKTVRPEIYGRYGIGLARTTDYMMAGIGFMTSTPNAKNLTENLAWDSLAKNIEDAHGMLTYLAWIDSQEGYGTAKFELVLKTAMA